MGPIQIARQPTPIATASRVRPQMIRVRGKLAEASIFSRQQIERRNIGNDRLKVVDRLLCPDDPAPAPARARPGHRSRQSSGAGRRLASWGGTYTRAGFTQPPGVMPTPLIGTPLKPLP